MMRQLKWLLAFACVVALGGLGGYVHAAALALSLPPSVQQGVTGLATGVAANAPSISGGAYPAGMSAKVAGRAVVMPAAARLAANAASAAVSAVRLSPGALIAGAVASWLIPYGIEMLNGEPVKEVQPVNQNPFDGGLFHDPSRGVCQTGCTAGEIGVALAAKYGQTYTGSSCLDSVCSYIRSHTKRADGTADMWGSERYATKPCTAGYTYVTATKLCSPNKQKVAPSFEDWAQVSANPLPDAAANELARKGVAIPVDLSVDPAPQTVPLSDPYTDPVTGKRYRDVARITPSPNPATPRLADIQVTREELDPATDTPATDPTTGEEKPEEETKDECLKYPDRVSCKDWGDTPDVEELKSSKTISITPASGWGATTAACPADLSTVTRNGAKTLSFAFKPVCDAADMFRPMVIALAWILATYIALGVSRGGE